MLSVHQLLPAASTLGVPLPSNHPQVSRQKLPADWHKRLEAIKSKISEAEKELPAGLLSQLPGPADAPVDYFRAVQVRDKLAASGERSLFGGLLGQAGTWDKIVKAYENGGEQRQQRMAACTGVETAAVAVQVSGVKKCRKAHTARRSAATATLIWLQQHCQCSNDSSGKFKC